MTSLFGLHSRSPKLLIVGTVLVVLVGSVLFSLNLFSGPVYPRPLQVGDRWLFRVVFPDSTSYNFTETVQKRLQINDTDTFEILRDDNQHISTSYLWITPDWHEIEVRRPSIGNLGASSEAIYAPPIEIVRIPLHVGDKWENNSTLTILTLIDLVHIRHREGSGPLRHVRVHGKAFGLEANRFASGIRRLRRGRTAH